MSNFLDIPIPDKPSPLHINNISLPLFHTPPHFSSCLFAFMKDMAPIKLLKILLSLICSAAAQALVFDQPEYSGPPQTISHGAYLSRVAAPACEPTDMAILHAGVTQVENFCHFYLSQTRVSSPVPALEPTTLTKLCRCTLPDILTKRTADVSKTSLQRPVTCRYPALEGIEAQYRDPRAFCAFWDTL